MLVWLICDGVGLRESGFMVEREREREREVASFGLLFFVILSDNRGGGCLAVLLREGPMEQKESIELLGKG